MRFLLVFLTGLILFGLTLYLHSRDVQLNFNSPGNPTFTTHGTTNVVKYPLMIDEMRKIDYPGGEIRTEEDLGVIGNHHLYIISYPSENLKLRALLSVPLKVPVAGLPVIIFNHGYIAPDQYSTVNSYRSFFDYFATNNFIVVKPDYRGHDQSEGEASGGHFTPDYTADVLNLLSSIKKYPGVDPNRIGIWGHSMGGHVTLRVDVISPDIKATVIAAGVVGTADDIFYNWTRKVTETPPNIASASSRKVLVDKFGDPKQNPDFWKSVFAINYVEAITGPVQLHHGTEDESVPKLFSDHLDVALKADGKPVEYFEYPGGDHNFTGVNRNLMLSRSVDFFNKNL